jgi:hypothetical protein
VKLRAVHRNLSVCSAPFIAWSAIFFCRLSAFADPQAPLPNQSDVADPSNPAGQDSNYNGGDFTRPETSVSTRLEYRTSSGTTSETKRERELLQFSSKLDLGVGWKLGTLVQLPFVEKTTTTFDPPVSDSNGGFSDAVFQGAVIRTVDAHWAYGFGARLVAPTAEESVGTDRWQIMPGVGVRYSFLEIGPDTYFVPVVRYAISFGGDPAQRTIREPQIAPTLNIGLPGRWFVTFYPSNDIRINYGTPISGQTGRLFLPLDIAIGKKFTNDLIVSLEGSVPIVKDYPVYDFKTELKMTWQF